MFMHFKELIEFLAHLRLCTICMYMYLHLQDLI